MPKEYQLDQSLEHEIFGCDLWVEVTGIDEEENPIDPREQACIEAGGTVQTSLCCLATGDFPDLCSTGACGCAPDNSHEVKICDCPGDACWNGQTCDSSKTISFNDFGTSPQYGYDINYGNANVSFIYNSPVNGNLTGTIIGSGLKPYATYQLKFEGKPICDYGAAGNDAINSYLGSIGRTWNNGSCVHGYLVWGYVTADGSGNFSRDLDVTGKGVSAGDNVTATTTHTDNNTSEFAATKIVTETGTIISTQTGNWETGTTWTGGQVPSSTDNAVVYEGHTVTVNDSRGCNSLSLKQNSTLLVNTALPTANSYDFDLISTVNYSKSGGQDVSSTPTYGKLTTSGSGTKTADGSLTINGNLILTESVAFNSNHTINVGGNVTIQNNAGFNPGGSTDIDGGLTLSDNSTFSPSSTANIGGNVTVQNDAGFNPDGSTDIDGSLTLSDNTTAQNNGQLTVGGNIALEGTSTLTLGSNLDANGNLTIGTGTTLNGGSHNINIAGNWSNNGTWNYNTSTMVFDEPSSDQTIGPSANSGGEVQVGTGTLDIGSNYPFYNFYENNKSQMLYLGSDIGQSGNIDEIQFDFNQVSDPGERDLRNFTVNLKETTDSNWSAQNGYVDMTGAVTVFSQDPFTMPDVTGWSAISFSTPFSYDNSKNLIVEIVWGDNGAWYSPDYELWGTDRDYYCVLYGRHDSETPPSYDGKSDDLPNIKFNFQAISGARNFYNLTVSTAGSPGTTTSQANLHIHNNLVINSGSELVMGENTLTVDGTITYNGPVSYSKTESPTNGVAKTFTADGMDILKITPSGDMGSTEAVVKKGTVCPNNAFGSSCTNTPLSVKRYFNISPTTPQTATIRFNYLSDELNGQTHGAGMKPYHWNSTSSEWEAVGTYVSHGGAGTSESPYYVEYSGISSYSPFILGSDGDPTLPVVLSTFTAQFLNNIPILYWTTQSESDNIGWYIYRNSDDNFSSAEKVSNFIEGYGTTSEPHNYIYEDVIENAIPGDTLWYWLESIDLSGMTTWYDRSATIIIPSGYEPQPEPSIPVQYGLYHNFPNPFNPSLQANTTIYFCLAKKGNVKISIYNIRGQLVKEIYNEYAEFDDKNPVPIKTMWDGKDEFGKAQKNGVYLYKLEVNGKLHETKQMIILR